MCWAGLGVNGGSCEGNLAEERDVDVVIEVSNTLYFKPALDLTEAASAAYDKAHPLQSKE